jgi:hypothetical protein
VGGGLIKNDVEE